MWPDWAIYWTLGNFLKPLAAINLPKSPTFLVNFCKGVKIYHFSSEIIFGQLLWTFGDFFWSHCLFSSFSRHIDRYSTTFDSVPGIRTRDCRMVDADKSTVLWRPPFLNKPFLASFSYYCLFNTVDIILMFNIKVCMWLDSNCGPLLLEATALPTEPQPLPMTAPLCSIFLHKEIKYLVNESSFKGC